MDCILYFGKVLFSVTTKKNKRNLEREVKKKKMSFLYQMVAVLGLMALFHAAYDLFLP